MNIFILDQIQTIAKKYAVFIVAIDKLTIDTYAQLPYLIFELCNCDSSNCSYILILFQEFQLETHIEIRVYEIARDANVFFYHIKNLRTEKKQSIFIIESHFYRFPCLPCVFVQFFSIVATLFNFNFCVFSSSLCYSWT